MVKLVVLYPPPKDSATFEQRYRKEHAPMVREQDGRSPSFDDRASLDAALGSTDGQAVVAHALEISTGGPMTVLAVEED